MGLCLPPRRFLAAVAVAGVPTAMLALWLGFGIGGETAVLFASDLGTLLAVSAAAGLSLRAGRHQSGRLRVFWWLVAAACGAWGLAEGIWGFYEIVLGVEVPVPSWADVGYLGAIPLAVAALLSHPAMRAGRARKARRVLDGLALATALLFLSWTFVLGPIWQSTDLTAAGGVVAVAYPFGDVVIVFFIVVALRAMTSADRLALYCLLGGLLAMALSDSTYAYLTSVKGYETGGLLDVGWVAGYLAIAVGAYSSCDHRTVPRRAEPSLPRLAPMLASFLPLLAALGVLAVEIHLGHRPDRVALTLAFALIVLVLVRQGLLLLDFVAGGRGSEGSVVTRLDAALLGRMPESASVESSPQPSHQASEP